MVVAPETAETGRMGHKRDAPQSKEAKVVTRRHNFEEGGQNPRGRSRNQKDDKSLDRDTKPMSRRRSVSGSVSRGLSKN